MLTKIKGYYKNHYNSLNEVQKKFFIAHVITCFVILIGTLINSIIILNIDITSSQFGNILLKAQLCQNAMMFLLFISQVLFHKIVKRSKAWIPCLIMSPLFVFIFYFDLKLLMR